jgi:hypothetical protein
VQAPLDGQVRAVATHGIFIDFRLPGHNVASEALLVLFQQTNLEKNPSVSLPTLPPVGLMEL